MKFLWFVVLTACKLDSSLDQTIDAPVDTAPDAAMDPVVRVATNHRLSCAVTQSGKVLCWGHNKFGQLGVAPAMTPDQCASFGEAAPCRTTPTVVPGIDNAVSVAVGGFHACAITADKSVVCWGANTSGQLGHNPSTDVLCSGFACNPTPTVVAGVANAEQVVASDDVTCAHDGNVLKCWGINAHGQLGTGATGTSTHVPTTPVGLATGVSRVATVGRLNRSVCAIKNGEVFCWGQSFPEGNLGHDPSTDPACSGVNCNATPTKVVGIAGAIDLTVGERTVCVVLNGGAVRCWGSNLYGQLGTGSTTTPSGFASQAVNGISQVTAITGSAFTTCAREMDGDVYCWGDASLGLIGDGNLDGSACTNSACRSGPTKVSLPATVALVSASNSALAIDSNGRLYGWGENGFGEVGHAPDTKGDVHADAFGSNGIVAPTPVTFAIP